MRDGTTLQPGFDPRYDLPPPRERHWLASRTGIAALFLLAALVLAAGAILGPRAFGPSGEAGTATSRIDLDQLRRISAMTVDDKSQILAEGLAAQQQNAEIPVSGLPLEAVRGIAFSVADDGTYATALKCLTQAVYFEAAHEPITGRRAVAQVVLNRMRHPAYPNSVCGVVYQGSERRTGCQFSFTCDGALLRTPMAALWREAQDVASKALAGYVEPSVGTATHYHADYVLPKWAFNLAKIEQIGRHIFYRFNGGLGKSLAFTARYSGIENLPQIDLAALRLKTAEDPALAAQLALTPGLTVAPEITDRHAPADVGGRLDVTKPWRLAIPDPVSASSRYRQALGAPAAGKPADIAAVEPKEPEVRP